ncbi:hypothetical protein [Undibacterium sp. Di24W]|uniref:hypothetical protein n=1 Tax=Undibacterium sp. Di24W TaxID=3413033 RepID=UPI003BF0F654
MPTLLTMRIKLLSTASAYLGCHRFLSPSNMLSAMLLFALFCAVPAQGQNLGRLFSTPAERVNLDRLRSQNKLGEQPVVETSPAPVTEVPPQEFTHNGFVKRSNGLETTWINQLPSQDQKKSSNIKVIQQLSKPPAVSVLLSSGKRQELKVGQSFDATTGKIREVYEAAPPRPIKKTEEKP